MHATDPLTFSLARESTSEAIRLFRAGCHEPALHLLRKAESCLPSFTPALAWQVPVLDALGRADEVAEFYDFRNSVMMFDLNCELAAASCSLSDAMAAWIRGQVKFKSGSARMPLVQAKVSGELATSCDPLLAEFQRRVMNCFSQYLAQARFRNPHIARMEDCWSSIWATRTSRQGRIGAHYHPRSWLTSVFYPTSQCRSARSSNECGGDLELGHLPSYMAALKTPHVFRVAPQSGRLIIFPAYLGHAVTPVTCAAARISIATDLCILEKRFGAEFASNVE